MITTFPYNNYLWYLPGDVDRLLLSYLDTEQVIFLEMKNKLDFARLFRPEQKEIDRRKFLHQVASIKLNTTKPDGVVMNTMVQITPSGFLPPLGSENEIIREIQQSNFDEESGLITLNRLQCRYYCQYAFNRCVIISCCFVLVAFAAGMVTILIIGIKNRH